MADGSVIIEAILKTDKARKEAQNLGDDLGKMPKKSGFSILGQDANKLGKKLGNVGTSLTKRVTKPVLGLGTAVGGMISAWALKGGIDRALNIEDAQAKLRGLGHDAEGIENIMDSALGSVKGTAFGLDEAATAAASAVAAGVPAGEDLTRVLSLTADAATIMGRSFGDSGAIVNKILAGNRVSMEEINQLQDAGLPILQMLADQYGVTALEMRDMVTKGEVDSEAFLQALETNIGGAALESGETARGAFANMKAAFSRVGAEIINNILPEIKDGLAKVTEWIDEHKDDIVSFVNKIVDAFKKLADSGLLPIIGKIILVVAALGPLLSAFDKVLKVLPLIKAAIGLIANPIGIAITIIGLLTAAVIYLWRNNEDFRNAVLSIWESIKEAISTGAEFVRGIIEQLAQFWQENGEQIKGIFASVFGAIQNIVQFALDIILGIIKIFTGIFTGDFDKALEGVKDIFSGAIDFVRSIFESDLVKWLVDKAIELGTKLGEKFNDMKNKVIEKIVELKTGVQNKWNEIKTAISTRVNDIVNGVRNKFNDMKSSVQNIFNNVKSTITNIMERVRSSVQSKIDAVKSAFNSIRSIGSTVSSVFSGVKNTISNMMESARSTVQNIINRIKGIFSGASFSLPKIKLPHLSVSGKFSLTPPQVPKFGISWYAKGGVFNGPSVIGVGEAGPEAVVPLSSNRMKPFADAIASAQGGRQEVVQNVTINASINSELDIDRIINQLTIKLKRKGAAFS